MKSEEFIISRPLEYDYTTINGLCAITGLSRDLLPYAVLKEIMDNALDAVEKKEGPIINIKVESNRILITDNGDGIDRRYIKKIFDYSHNTSSKHFIKRPSRGRFGAGLKLVPAIVSVLAREDNAGYDNNIVDDNNGNNSIDANSKRSSTDSIKNYYFRLRSRDYELKITDVKSDSTGIKCDMNIIDMPNITGTDVEVVFHKPLINTVLAKQYIVSYMIANPWVGFFYLNNFYMPVSRFNLKKKSSIHYYSKDEFLESFRWHKTNYPEMELRRFISEFTERSLARDLPTMQLSSIKDSIIDQIYDALIVSTGKPTIGMLGKKRVVNRIERIFGSDHNRIKYAHATIDLTRNDNDKGNTEYSVWEAYCIYYEKPITNGDVIFCINNSITLRNPLRQYVLTVDEGKKKIGIDDILRSNGINGEDARRFVILLHVSKPNALYGGYAKANVDLNLRELDTAYQLLKKVTSWYRAYKGRTSRIDIDVVIEEVVRIVREYNADGIRPTVRHIFYKIGSSGRNIIPFNDKGYRIVVNAAKLARLKGIIPIDSITDRSRYYIDCAPEYEHVDEVFISSILEENLHRLGSNPWLEINKYVEIWVEKDSMIDFIKPLAKKYNLTVLACRGYPSISSLYNRFRSILDYGCKENVILYLGDHDPSGLDIERDIKQMIRDLRLREYLKGIDVDIVIKRVAVTQEQAIELNLPTCPLKEGDKRSKKYRIDYDKAWELEAIEPEKFYNILENSIVAEINDKEKWESIIKKNLRLRESFSKKIEEISKTIGEISNEEGEEEEEEDTD
ncbi:MAG: ATP-binding protein [Candidatus Nitrosocaldaceae archaeon]